jgi:hypothetical protein
MGSEHPSAQPSPITKQKSQKVINSIHQEQTTPTQKSSLEIDQYEIEQCIIFRLVIW